jgi:hypothetical protein
VIGGRTFHNVWNYLPKDAKTASSYQSFERKLKTQYLNFSLNSAWLYMTIRASGLFYDFNVFTITIVMGFSGSLITVVCLSIYYPYAQYLAAWQIATLSVKSW